MRIPGSMLAVAIAAFLLAAGLVVRALATSQPGPLDVASSTTHAILGNSTSAAAANGIIGYASNGNGVYGRSQNAKFAGVYGASTAGGFGVEGTSGGVGVLGTSTNDDVGVEAIGGNTTGYGVYATGYAAVVGDGSGAAAGSAGVLGEALGSSGAAVSATTIGDGPLAMSAYSTHAGGYVMSLDQNGNMILSGTLTSNGSPLAVVRGSGAARVSYSAQSAAPAIEDTGEGRIALGSGYVAIDPSFASTLDPRAPYAVLVTPQGDCRGLYVTAKTRRGFMVRELMNGRSTVAFDYRIVGRPGSDNAPRLPLFTDGLKRMPKPAYRRAWAAQSALSTE